MQLLSAEFKKFAKNPLHVHERSYGIPNSAINYQLNGKFRQPIPINATAFAFRHIVSPVSYLVKCYFALFSFFNHESIPKNAKIEKIINPKIESKAVGFFLKSNSIGYVCTAIMAAPISIINFSKLYKSPLVATLSKDAFKACTCALACFSGTPLVTKSSYTCKVSICAIVNHLIKSVSKTIYKLAQNVNTFLYKACAYIRNSSQNYSYKETKYGAFNGSGRCIHDIIYKSEFYSYDYINDSNKSKYTGKNITKITHTISCLAFHNNYEQYTHDKDGLHVYNKTIKITMGTCAFTINRLTNLLRSFHKKLYCGNLCKMSYKTFAMHPIPKRRKLSLTFIHPNLYFSANSLKAIFKSFLVTYTSWNTCMCSAFIKSLISLNVLSSSWIMSKSPLDHLLTQLSHTLSPMSTREVLSWQ